MNLLAIGFVTPWLLAGLLGAAIPPIMHLLSSRRAKEAPFPTLRFLTASMNRSVRRRRIRHWLLMILRSGLLAALAIGAAQLLIDADWNLGTADRYAGVFIVDTSGSMQTTHEGVSRLMRAKTQLRRLLTGPDAPATAAVMTTDGSTTTLTTDPAALRESVDAIDATAGRTDLSGTINKAVAALDAQGLPDRRVYVFTDLQRADIERLTLANPLGERRDIRLLLVDTGSDPVDNVGLADLAVAGQGVIDQPIEIAATVRASGEGARHVTARLAIDGRPVGPGQTVTVNAEPRQIAFTHRFAETGAHSGEVILDADDDLAIDDRARFDLTISRRVRALIVGGPAQPAGHDDSASVLLFALDPRASEAMPWSIRPRLVRWDQADLEDLAETVDTIFLADVPRLSAGQAKALTDFVGRGGSAAFFLGPNVDTDAYNERLAGLLGARLGRPVGQTGLTASAKPLEWVDLDHPYFDRLGLTDADCRPILTQRYFPLDIAASAAPACHTLMRLAGGQPLVMVRPFGRGQVLVCATTASLQWTKLGSAGVSLFVPMLERICLDSIASAETEADRFDGSEFDLARTAPAEVVHQLGEGRCFVGESVEQVEALAAEAAEPTNLSELFLALVALALLAEAVIANNRARQ